VRKPRKTVKIRVKNRLKDLNPNWNDLHENVSC